MATYAIGDVQGCYKDLQNLLDEVAFSASDTLWFAGDMVNRGPDSLQTLRFIKNLGSQAICVLGNHDLHLLAVHYGSVPTKRSDTIDDILKASDRDELMNWLRFHPLLHWDQTNDYAMVHAGIPPCWSIKKSQKRAQEVEQILKSTLAREYFNHMYGNKPDIWSSEVEGWNRLRLITNYLTRIRFCTAKGKLDFNAKGTLESQPKGYAPWFIFPRKKAKEQHIRILFGHWAALNGQIPVKNVFGLDTGCVWGNALTALRLEDKKIFKVKAQNKKLHPPPTSFYLRK